MQGSSIGTVTLIEIMILAIIQGVTEWLPVSSSGHLALAQRCMGLSLPVFFDVILHVGSLLVVIVALREEIVGILRAIIRLDFKSEEGRLALLILLGSVPTAIIGFIFEAMFESLFNNPLAIGVALLATGILLFATKYVKNQSRSLHAVDSVLIGTAQGIALIPGISRSGATVATGLLRGIDRQKAFAFSFLLFIPAVLGATVLTVGQAQNLTAVDVGLADIVLGLVTTIVVGYLSLRLLRTVVLKGKLHWFAFYCWALGFTVVLAQFL